MADIKLVVKIPESIWVAIQNGEYCGILDDRTYNAIKNGTPLPKGYGRIGDLDKLIQTMKERNDDNGGEPMNAVDRGYDLAYQHMVKEAKECIIIEADKGDGGNDG